MTRAYLIAYTTCRYGIWQVALDAEGRVAMISPHLWPRPVKSIVVLMLVLVVVLGYTTLCSSLLALAVLFS